MEIKKLYNTDNEKNNTLNIDWFFGNKTKLTNVPYIHRKFYDGSLAFPSIEDIENFVSQLHDHYGNRRIVIRSVNGDLSLHPERDQILQVFFKYGILLSPTISSDFTQWWAENSFSLSTVIFNFHPEFSNLNNLIALKLHFLSIGTFVITNINVTPDNFLIAKGAMKKIIEKTSSNSGFYLNYRLNFEDVNKKPLKYTEEQLTYINNFSLDTNISEPAFTVIDKDDNTIKMNFNDLLLNHNYFKGFNCNVGLDQLVVTATGQVRRAWCGVSKSIGRINGNIDFPNTTIVCNKERCFNGFDIMAKKVK